MINRMIEFSMKNRWLVLAVYAALAGWGYWALLRHAIDAIPDLSENQVIVFTDWAGRARRKSKTRSPIPYGEPAGPAARAHRAVSLGLRLLDGQRHLRGLGRHLLRPHPRSGAAFARRKLPPRRRHAHDGPRCDRRWPGLLVHGRRPVRQRDAAFPAGLVHQVPAQSPELPRSQASAAS